LGQQLALGQVHVLQVGQLQVLLLFEYETQVVL